MEKYSVSETFFPQSSLKLADLIKFKISLKLKIYGNQKRLWFIFIYEALLVSFSVFIYDTWRSVYQLSTLEKFSELLTFIDFFSVTKSK